MSKRHTLNVLLLIFLCVGLTKAQSYCCDPLKAKAQGLFDNCEYELAERKLNVAKANCENCDVTAELAKVRRCKSNPNADGCPCKVADKVPKSVNGVSFTMIAVLGGSFQMGSTSYSSEQPIHNVTVPDFKIGETEVTQALWRAVMVNNPSSFSGCDECPVERVSWNDIQEFLTKLNQLTGEIYRLPTEAEWEYAARGGNKSKGYTYSGSNTLDDVAWYSGNSGSKTHPVKTKTANELGIYDMSGNLWEWCDDWYHDSYQGGPTDGSAWVSGGGTYRLLRGGSWGNYISDTRIAVRSCFNPPDRNDYLGFRLAQD